MYTDLKTKTTENHYSNMYLCVFKLHVFVYVLPFKEGKCYNIRRKMLTVSFSLGKNDSWCSSSLPLQSALNSWQAVYPKQQAGNNVLFGTDHLTELAATETDEKRKSYIITA